MEVANEDPVIDCRLDSTPGGQYPGDDEQRVQEWPSLMVRSHCQHPATCEDRAQLEIAFGGMAWMPPCSPRARFVHDDTPQAKLDKLDAVLATFRRKIENIMLAV
jgi:hypothetical protein